MNDDRRILGMTGLCLADLLALLRLRPDLDGLAHDVAGPHSWVARVGADGAAISLAGAALWCLALWLGVGLLAAVAGWLPGTLGRVARQLARTLLPATLYRIVAGATGLGVLLGPVVAGAAAPGPPARAAVHTAAPVIPAPIWPTTPPAPTARPGVTPARPAPAWPTSPAATPRIPRRDPAADGRRVVVQPGESLWRIAAAKLGPAATPAQVASAWPRWYAANRATIGADPDLIRPGQHLQSPTGAPS